MFMLLPRWPLSACGPLALVCLWPRWPLTVIFKWQLLLLKKLIIFCFLVKWLWAAKDTGRVEAVVGPYKLYDSSFRTLEDSGWLSDEVVEISSQSVLLLDPLGNEGCYERKVMRNWRNFLKMKGKEESRVDWRMETLPHNKQMDSSSCGVLVLKFAEHYLLSGEVTRVLSTPEAIGLHRTEIACELLEHQSNADDYCVVCSMLEADPESSMIEMVQCEFCSRWAHFGCAQYESSLVKYLCDKCA
ncbi:uncharacterized protein LOC113010669 isoform X4 [Astatotilapia calliptera]|uniref:uncharacterized protein LOC113010669 isoform X4 n=1 Tax=Astatotilapia calliptera TaxID=8154 RepID=UPI000E42117A|nr:uncharacterized protein LOC113010669 isoform X4 [Astatotilapia calliptera]